MLEQRRANVAPRHAQGVIGPERGDSPPRPYKGLAAFEPDDAADFFGRERLVAELVARLAGTRLLAVVGPSGSGKSSLVRAGLLPALATGVLPVTGGWTPVIATPSAAQSGRDDLGRASERSPSGTGRRLVFVDQFEELFTNGLDRHSQSAFVARIVSTAHRPDSTVVLAVRADHLDRCASFPELAGLITGNDVLVGPMRDVELRRAIERPAQRAGGTFEPELVDLMIADVAGRPGALPLLVDRPCPNLGAARQRHAHGHGLHVGGRCEGRAGAHGRRLLPRARPNPPAGGTPRPDAAVRTRRGRFARRQAAASAERSRGRSRLAPRRGRARRTAVAGGRP